MKEKRPFHVVFMIDELKVKGGTERHLLDLATGMVTRGHHVTIFSLQEGEFVSEVRCRGLQHICLNVKRVYSVTGILAIAKLARFIREAEVDVVHTFHTASDLVGPVAGWLSGRDLSIYSSRRDLGYTKSWRHIAVQKYVNNLITGILANSSAVQASVYSKENYPLEKITVIHNGIDTDCFAANEGARDRIRRELSVKREDVLIGSVGNIRPIKGYEVLLRSAASICGRYPNVHFVHIGEGTLTHKEPNPRFTFLGSRQDIPSLLSALDIYVQPSLSEGFSNAILEAMAAGLPVVATNVGGNPEVIENGVTGILVPPRDEHALAAALSTIIEEYSRHRVIADRGRALVLERFQINTMIDNYESMYRSAVKS